MGGRVNAYEDPCFGALPTDKPYRQRPGIVPVPIDDTPARYRPVAEMTVTMLAIIRDDATETPARRSAAAVELAKRLAACSAALGLGGAR